MPDSLIIYLMKKSLHIYQGMMLLFYEGSLFSGMLKNVSMQGCIPHSLNSSIFF